MRTVYLSVDPYMRGRMSGDAGYADAWPVGEVMRAGVVGEVVRSAHPDWSDGDVVQGRLQWAEYATASGDDLRPVDPELAPISTALGVLGMPGCTGYFGMRDVARPRAGDTVVVSAAAGAVGSVAAQIARLTGCRVVGTTGSDRKCTWLESTAEIDQAVNYRAADDLDAALASACPDGVDVYFDNVGGSVTDAVFDRLNTRSRVAVCGQIALYNEREEPTGPRKLRRLVGTRARVEGFLVGDYAHRRHEAEERLAAWIDGDELAYEETVTNGIERAVEAFLGLFEGDNLGKQLVRMETGDATGSDV